MNRCEINYCECDRFFQIADKLREIGITDKGDVISIETVGAVYRIWYWVK